jgi:glycosyltransferase involved in cell wall biosynthesis
MTGDRAAGARHTVMESPPAGGRTAPSRPLRVLHLVPSFVGGGSERQVCYLATALANRGLEVHVGYVHGGPNLERLRGTDVRLHRLDASGNHDPRLVLTIARLIRSTEPDVVQTWLLQMDVLGGIAARASGVPWVLSERTSPAAYTGHWKYRLRKALGRGASAIVANSVVGLDYWNGPSEAARRLTIRNIVPLDAIDAASPAAGDPADVLRNVGQLIVSAGRFEAEKNWLLLIQALKLTLSRRADVHAVIFGEGSLRDAMLRAASGPECPGRIHIRSYTSDLWTWLKRASVYVSVSHFEGSPNVLLEAVACRRPVVASDIPGHRELLSEAEADFVPTNSAAAVADAIERNLTDSQAVAARVRQASERVQQWSPAGIAAQYDALYREVARGNSRPA